jgi:hypothetical protein
MPHESVEAISPADTFRDNGVATVISRPMLSHVSGSIKSLSVMIWINTSVMLTFALAIADAA